MKWLQEVKKGKYKGIQQAGLLYGYAKTYPQYIELTVYELMEKLNDNDVKIQRNAYWMISKISKQFNHHRYLVPVIPILGFGIKQKNEKIILYSLKTLLNLSQTIVKKVIYLNKDILDHFDAFEKENQIISLKVLANFAESQKIIPTDDFFLKYFKDQRLLKELINLLIHKKSYKSIFPSLLNSLQYESLQSIIYNFIEKSCEEYPFKIILALKKSLVRMDPLIRQNSLLIFQKIRNNSKIYLLIPEILKLVGSKIHSINRISLYFLYDIHKQILKELFFYLDDLLKLRKKGDQITKNIINSILVDMSSQNIQIIKKIHKKIYTQLKSKLDSDDARFATIITLGYSKISLWTDIEENKEDFITLAINPCLNIIRKFPNNEYSYEIYERIGILFLYSKSLEKCKKYLEKALNIEDYFFKTLNSKLLLILINFIQHLPKTALELKVQLVEEYKKRNIKNKGIRLKIESWNSIFDDLFHLFIDNAIEKLKIYYSKNKINNKWENNFRLIIQEYLKEVKII